MEEKCLAHNSVSRYILNLTSFHNAHIIRRYLPRELFSPKPLIPPEQRRSTHDTIADALHSAMNRKRADAKAKRAEKLAASKGNAKSTLAPPFVVPAPGPVSSTSGPNTEVTPLPARGNKRQRCGTTFE